MRSPVVITALVLVTASAVGCHPYRGAPVGAAAIAGAEPVRPSGLGTRATFELPNGLNVILEENHAAPVVAVQAWVHVGSADDLPGQEGMAHLFQHLLFLATKTRPRGNVAREIAEVGGRIGAWASHDQTIFHEVVASANVDLGIGLLAETLGQTTLTPADVESARRGANDDLRQSTSDPGRIAAQVALSTAFATHPYGGPLLGTVSSLAAITIDNVKAFFDRFYVASNTTLVIVGDFDSSVVRGLVTASFGSWRPGVAAPPRPGTPEQTAPRVAVVTADVSVPQLVVAFRTPGLRGQNVPALELLAAVLGPGRGGRVEVEIARNRQLATGARAYLFSTRDTGLLVTTAALGPGRVDEAAHAVIDEVMRLSRELIGPEELARARTIVEGDGASDKAGLDGYARKLGHFASVAGDAGFEATYLDALRKVDSGDIRDTAARVFRPSNLTLAVVLPVARDPQHDDRAAKLTPRLSAVAAASGARHGAPVAAPGPVAASGRDVVDYALPSGVRLLVLPDDTATQLSIRAVWSGGVRFEDGRLAGATSMLARLLSRGTKTRGPEQLASDLAEVSGTIDGIAGTDTLGLRGDFLASRWERGIELMIDCLRNPKLSDDDVERERRVLLDAIRTRDDDPTELALRLFAGALFGRHPYRQDLLGTADSVAGLTRRRLLDHYRRFYGPRGLTLAVVGAIEPDRIAAKIQSLFADLPPRGEREIPPAVAQPTRSAPTEVVQLIPKIEARIVLGYPGVTARDPDRFALEVLAEVLGGPAGRLARLRDQGGIVGGVGVTSQEGVDPGYLALYVATRPDALDTSVTALRAVLGVIVDAGVTDEEVTRARRILVGTRSLALERRGAVALALALHGAFGEAARSYRRDVAELAKVTTADVIRIARKVIDPRREVLAVVRPRGPSKTLAGQAEGGTGYTSSQSR